jgi:hypothetical protein
MTRLIALTTAVLFLTVSFAVSQEKAKSKPKTKPNINESKEYDNVFHSPSADSTPFFFGLFCKWNWL